MQKKITFSGREHTPALDQHIESQLAKIEKFLSEERSPKSIDFTVEFHEVHQHNRVAMRIKTPHYDCYAEHEGPDAIQEINEVVDRIYSQLRDTKKKLVDFHRHGCDKQCRAEMSREIEEEMAKIADKKK